MAQDKTKHLIPCFKGIDAYDMPKEFHRLQAQDMGKVGAIQDLLRGIEKLSGRGTVNTPTAVPAPVSAPIAAATPGVESLLKRGWMFLADKDWNKADEYFDKVLDIDPECAEAYTGRFCAGMKVPALDVASKECSYADELEDSSNFQKALRFAVGDLRTELEQSLLSVKKNQKLREEEAERRSRENVTRLKPFRERITMAAHLISFGGFHTVGLKADGSVLSVSHSLSPISDVSNWNDIVAVSAGLERTVGLKADGTVVAAGDNHNGQCNVSDWSDIVAVSAGWKHTVGLKADGTAVAVGDNEDGQCEVSSWADIVAVSAGGSTVSSNVFISKDGDSTVGSNAVISKSGCSHTVGLKADGSVLAVGDNYFGQCDVSGWTGIVAVSAGSIHTVGLKADGTVVAVGSNFYGQCEVSGWTDIVAVSAGGNVTVGLKADGTVIAVGYNFRELCDVSDWTDIVAVSAFSDVVGLKADGTVVTVGLHDDHYNTWHLFNSLDTLEQDRADAKAQKIKAEAFEAEKQKLQADLSDLKDMFFTGRRRKEIEARLAEIDAELKKIK